MWEDIWSVLLNHGLMSALFVGLLYWVLRDAKERERKYQCMVDKLHNALADMKDIKDMTQDIQKRIPKKTNCK